MEGDPAETRQSVDIPLPICLVTISHAVEEKICACCRGEFPLPCQTRCQLWGERPCGGSLSGRGAACPFQAFTVLVERPLRYRTEPSISDILNRMKKRPSSAYGEILRRVESSPVVGADETGEYPDGGSHWMWVFQNEVATYIFPDPSHGKNAMYEHFPDGLPGSVPVTDRHSSCFNMRLACHQLCLAHLVRHKEHILKLLRNPRVPSDNNSSERSVRPLKVKQKVSGMFKIEEGSDAFCPLHSLIDTARKNGQGPFLALRRVAGLG